MGLAVAGLLGSDTYDEDRSLSIGSTGQSTGAPMSVFGQLELRAPTIEQGGALYAPLGYIYLGDTSVTKEVDLLSGSLTSVSAAGLVIPYGETLDDLTYSYADSKVREYGVGGMTGPLVMQGVSLRGSRIVADDGSVLDLSGGGTLTGAAFVSGRGGSTDPLFNPLVRFGDSSRTFSLPSLGTNPVYAIVPGYGDGYAPVTPVDQAADYGGSLPAIGQQVTIGTGVPGLPADTYTLLPSYYALLPGTYRVELGAQARTAFSPMVMRNGSWIATGELGVANTSVQRALPTQLTITPGNVLRAYAQYNETSYQDFVVQQAARSSAPRPMLPVDAKSLEIRFGAGQPDDDSDALVFNGQAKFDHPTGGYGGQVIIDTASRATPIEIVGETRSPDFDGISVRARDLNAIGASRIAIGGSLSGTLSGNGADGEIRFSTISGDIYVRNGAALTAPEVVLIAGGDNDISVEQGASINTIGAGLAPYDSTLGYTYNAEASGSVNLLFVSNGWIDMPGGTSGGTGAISIGGCGAASCGGTTDLYSDGSIVFGANNVNIKDNGRFGTRNLTLAVSSLNIGGEDALQAAGRAGTLPSGLQLSQDTLARLLHGDSMRRAPALERLIFSVRDSVNFFGTVDLDTRDPSTGDSTLSQFVLNAPAIFGYGGADDVASVSTGTFVWNGVAGGADPAALAGGPGTGIGTLDIRADTIIFGYSDNVTPAPKEDRQRLALGFGTVTLRGADRITANGTGGLSVYQAQGALVDGAYQYTGGDLSLITPVLTGEAGSINRITAGGKLEVSRPAIDASTGGSDALGASLSLNAQSVIIDTTVALPSGKISITSQDGLTLNDSAYLDVAGRTVAFDDQQRYSWGGEIALESENGDIVQSGNATIDLSAQNNDAGILTATAVSEAAGRIALNGRILGGTSGALVVGGSVVPYDAGAIELLAQQIDDFVGLNHRLNDGGVTGLRSFRIKQGDLTIGDEVRAREVDISVDGGSLTVAGKVDASGTQVGTIRLAARDALTLLGSAVLDARGTEPRVDSSGGIIDAVNRAIVELTSGTGGQGALAIQPGATIDLRTGTAVHVGTAPGENDGKPRGTLTLNAPRLGAGAPSDTGAGAAANATGDDIDILVSGSVSIQGAASIALNGYANYTNAPSNPDTPNSQLINQDYLGQMNTDSNAFISGLYGGNVSAGILRDSVRAKLAGLLAYGDVVHVRPGVDIRSATPDGDLVVEKDLDLSGYRYGPAANPAIRGSGEPGALSIQAGGDLTITGSISDGFAPPPATPDDSGWQHNQVILAAGVPAPAEVAFDAPFDPNFGTAVYVFDCFLSGAACPEVVAGSITDDSGVTYLPGSGQIPFLLGHVTIAAGTVLTADDSVNAQIVLVDQSPPRQVWAVAPMLPAGSLSWDLRLTGGSDLTAADRRGLRTPHLLNGKGNVTLDDEHFMADGVTPVFSVIRTGTGDLEIQAGGNYKQNSLFGVYTAGTQSQAIIGADEDPVTDAWGHDSYNLPRGMDPSIDPSSVLGPNGTAYESLATDGNYTAWYPEKGGNVSITVQGDMSGLIRAGNNAPTPDNPVFAASPSDYVGSWLWHQGGKDGNQATAWWVNFGSYVSQSGVSVAVEGFSGIGALGGGNLDVRVGGDAGVLRTVSDRSTAKSDGLSFAVGSTGRMKPDGTLAMTGGGDIDLKIGGALNPGVQAGASGVPPLYQSVPSDLNGVLTNVRGFLDVRAGAIGSINPLYGVVESLDPRSQGVLTAELGAPAGGPALVLGDASAALDARGDVVLDGVGDVGRMTSRSSLQYGVVGDKWYTGGGTSWYSLWTPNTAVSLFSAGGNLTPITAQYYSTDGVSVLGNTSVGNDAQYVYPSKLDAVAASGSIYYGKKEATTLPLVQAPNAAGTESLDFMAADSIFAGGYPIHVSGADPSIVPTPGNPAFVGMSESGDPVVNNAPAVNPYSFFAYGIDTASGSLYKNDSEPVRFYAATGDLVGVSTGQLIEDLTGNMYRAAKPVSMRAGRDIVRPAGLFLNNNPTDISTISAGRDIIYANVDIMGPGLLNVTAGRSLRQEDQGSLSSVGLINSAGDLTLGAGITVTVGTGAYTPNYNAFVQHYVVLGNLADAGKALADQPGKVVKTYGLDLVQWLDERYGFNGNLDDAAAFFATLPMEQQAIFARQIYFAELTAGGREFNDADGPRRGSYLRGRLAIASLFPSADSAGAPINYKGDVIVFGGSGVQTQSGGDIQMLAPGGSLTFGEEGPQPPSTAGVITQGSGNIQMYSLGSILLGQSRIMTTFGGSILAWSARGDINAGRGSKTTVVYTPPRRVYDQWGNVKMSPNVPSTGAGIATLAPIPEVPSGTVDLIASEGTVDIGEAGVRSSGGVNIAALHVVNAANIQAAGEVVGVPVLAAVNVGALTSASAASSSAATAAQDTVQRGRAAARQAMPSIFSVQVLGFGSEPVGGKREVSAYAPSGLQSKSPRYDPTSYVQLIGHGPDFKADMLARLTDDERRQLKQDR